MAGRHAPTAPYYVEDQSGVTIAVAVLVRIQCPTPAASDVERWVKEIDAAIQPVFHVEADTPVGIAIRVTERSGKRIAEDLILDAAVDCPAFFRRAEEEKPTRTVAHVDKPQGGITN